MAKTQRGGTTGPHHPTISPQIALRRLERLLEQIQEVQSQGWESTAVSKWASDVKIVLGEFYGESSLHFREFERISFGPIMVYSGQPDSEFVRAFEDGLDHATGFLKSRISDLGETLGTPKPSSGFPTFTPDPNSRKVFVVHGSDQGQKDTVSRFLEKVKLEPIILHEQPDQGKTIIEKFESHSAGVQCAVVILTPWKTRGRSPRLPKSIP
jgi:Predicted nucleotide-binding protein containing TIR-like domain